MWFIYDPKGTMSQCRYKRIIQNHLISRNNLNVISIIAFTMKVVEFCVSNKKQIFLIYQYKPIASIIANYGLGFASQSKTCQTRFLPWKGLVKFPVLPPGDATLLHPALHIYLLSPKKENTQWHQTRKKKRSPRNQKQSCTRIIAVKGKSTIAWSLIGSSCINIGSLQTSSN